MEISFYSPQPRPSDVALNTLLKSEPSLTPAGAGGQVSRLQVAELVAAAIADPSLAENKCLEVVAETTAPLVSYEELLGQIPVEITQEDKIAREEAAQKAAADVAAAEELVSPWKS